jgi:anaerobic carbon-monoxide dehydrogenase iron sulfur subunit
MAKKILVIDTEKCTGCRKCELVCAVYHTGTTDPARSRIKVLKWDHVGFYLPLSCQNCDHASCAEVCPSGACKKDNILGVAVINQKVCIGCKSCVLACPFGVPTFDHVSGTSVKCDYCGGNPQCVPACEAGAISYIYPDEIGMVRRSELSSKMIAEQINFKSKAIW